MTFSPHLHPHISPNTDAMQRYTRAEVSRQGWLLATVAECPRSRQMVIELHRAHGPLSVELWAIVPNFAPVRTYHRACETTEGRADVLSAVKAALGRRGYSVIGSCLGALVVSEPA